MEKRGMLAAIFTGYPSFKLRDEGLSSQKVHSFPYLQMLYLRRGKVGLSGPWATRELAFWCHVAISRYAARRLPECDAFVGLSGSGLEAGLVAQRAGAIYVCDRGSAHIRVQESILASEYEKLGISRMPIDPRRIDREEAEYTAADLITVPSTFALNSFLDQGVPKTKLRKIPYGVDLSMFFPSGTPDPERFDVLFVGGLTVQKGIHYLLEAYSQVRHPKKSLRFVGTVLHDVAQMVKDAAEKDPTITIAGHCPQPKLKDVMSTHHVLVLPSVQDGFGLVMGQAMACGCPVIASENTGARDLFEDGQSGYIVPTRDVAALAERLQQLADSPSLRMELGRNALEDVKKLGGWDSCGDQFVSVLEEAVQSR